LHEASTLPDSLAEGLGHVSLVCYTLSVNPLSTNLMQ